ncbi:MAG: Sec-independent protein translocase subunit TatA [Moraxellaceae bacterium]|nr:MAG: Sec-independent protein translocase subunit TatA [Moraxellaceae bacterium]
MAGLSIWHIVLFAIVVILLFGTSKLKNLGKDLGGAVKDFKDSVKQEDAKTAAETSRLHDERVVNGKTTASEQVSSQDKT